MSAQNSSTPAENHFPPDGSVHYQKKVRKIKVPEIIAFIVGIFFLIGSFLLTLNGGKIDKRASTENGLLQMQEEASRSVEDFWGNFFQTDDAAEAQLRAMLNDDIVQVMTVYGNAACKENSENGGTCGFSRMAHDLAAAISKAAGGADQVGCDMKSNRLEFKYICPHTGKPMYRIHRNRPHEMSGSCVFDTSDSLRENNTSVRANVTLDWNRRKSIWKVTQFSVMLDDKIVRVDAKGVKQEKIFR